MQENQTVQTAQSGQHTLTIENTKRITATGIEGVQGFSPTQFILLYGGGKILVGGTDMKITAFSKQTGAFSASGEILSVKYVSSGGGLKNKIFK